MEDDVKLGHVIVTCEGYEGPLDPYVLRDSCGLKYSLEYTSWTNFVLGKYFFIYFLFSLKYINNNNRIFIQRIRILHPHTAQVGGLLGSFGRSRVSGRGRNQETRSQAKVTFAKPARYAHVTRRGLGKRGGRKEGETRERWERRAEGREY